MGKEKRGYKKYKKYKKYKTFVEIYTSKNKWKRVELIEDKGDTIIIKLPSGEVLGRKNKRVRPVTNRVSKKITCDHNSQTKKLRSKKKRRKRTKKNSNRPVFSNKWRDPKKMKPEDYKDKR